LTTLTQIYGLDIIDKVLALSIQEILAKNEILIGFIGTGNTGKSTVLNAILQDE